MFGQSKEATEPVDPWHSDSYLQLDEDRLLPLDTALLLALAVAAGAAALAAITTVGTTAKLDPEHIRVE